MTKTITKRRGLTVFRTLASTVILLLLLGTNALKAQTYFTEGFEGTWYLNGNSSAAATAAGPNAPSSWTQTRLVGAVVPVACAGGAHDWGQMSWSGTAYTSVNLTGTSTSGCSAYGGAPTSPPQGTKVLWFYDGNCTSGNTRRIESPAVDLSTATNVLVTFSFSYAQSSTACTFVGSNNGGSTWNTISALATTTSGSWVTRTFSIPASYNVSNAKFGFQIASTYGSYDVFIDNMVVREAVTPSAAPVNLVASNVTTTGTLLSWDDASTNEFGFRVFRSTDNVNFTQIGADIPSTTIAGTGTTYSLQQTGLTFNTTYYYKVTAYADATITSSTISQLTAMPTLSGFKTVCPSGCDYVNLTAATADVASKGLLGPVVLELEPSYVSTSETFPITFGNYAGASATNTLSVTLNSSSTGLSIANTATTGTAQTIDMNGASYVSIDGRPGSTGTTSQLSISSVNLGTQTIRYINGANNNTLNYVSVTGVNNGTTSATYGLIAFLGTTGTTSTSGNRFNTISNCTIGAGATSPLKGIYSAGQSATILNEYNSVLNCNFVDIFNVTAASTQNCLSIDLSGSNNSDWTITGNSFYLTAARAHTAGAIVQTGVYTGAGNGYNISNNYFGGSGPQCSGTWTINGTAASYRYNAINMSGGTVRTSNIQGNTISNFNIISTTTVASAGNPLLGGIIIQGSGNVNVGDITPNLIGSSSAVDNLIASNSASITTNGNGVVGIWCSSTGIVNIKNNVIGGLTHTSGTATIAGNVVGIMNTGGTGKKVISGNTIGGNFSNSFRAGTNGFSTTGANTVVGITNTGAGVVVMSGNNISNFVAYATTGATAIRGVTVSSGTDTIANNIFSNFSTNGAGTVMGIASSTTTAGIDITRNSMNNFTVVNGSASARGIQISSGTATPRVAYNFIQGITASSSNGNAMIMGIDIGHTAAQNIYNNTIMLDANGSPLTGVTNFGVIGISYNTGTTDIRNNLVYVNATAIGTGVNIALRKVSGTNGTAPSNLANTSNSNIYYVPSADYNYFYAEGATANRTTIVNAYHNCASCTNSGVTTAPVVDANINSSCAKYKAFMGASSSREGSSFYENVTFAGGSTVPNNLIPAPSGGTFVLNGGSVVSGLTTDYFGNAVSGTTPDIGASEFTSGTTQDATAPSITYTAIAATACATNPTLTATITDLSGVDFASNPPALYYRYSTDAVTGLASANNNTVGGWKYVTASSKVGNNFTFTMDYSLLNTTVAAGTTIQYFVVAQDLAATPNVKLSTVGLASGYCPTSVALASGAFPIVASPTVNSYTISATPTITLTTVKTENCTGGVSLTLSGSDGVATYDFQYSTFSNGTWTSYATQPTKVSATSYTLTGLNATTNNNDIVRLVATCPSAGASLFTSSQDTIKNLGDCQFAVTRTTNNTPYTSIIANGTGNTFKSVTSCDDGKTNNISLAGTTFKYRGKIVKGFYATTNGWVSLDTTQSGATYTNDLTSTGQNTLLAPFWDDLVIKGYPGITATSGPTSNLNNCMRYKINGTLGSGTADIIIEYKDMERYSFPAPNLNWRVVLHEVDNSIEYNYDNMQLYDGSSNTTTDYSYSIGLNGTSPATADFNQRMMLQNENSTNFSATTVQNSLIKSPECYSTIKFVPALTYSGGAAPSLAAPSNDNSSGAIALAVNSAPCTSLCGTIYSSKTATASTGITACSASTPGVADDDVWFSFTTTVAPQYKIVVNPSLNYDVVFQVFNSSMTPVACFNANGVGIAESVSALALSSGTYYVRVYDAATGSTSAGEFGICISEVIPPPTNDEATTATNLTVGNTCVPTNSVFPNILAATASAQAACSGTADDDVWYKFTASASGITVTVNGVGTYNPVMQIFSDSGMTQVTCQNNTGNGGQETYHDVTFNPGQVYYVRVYHAGIGAANGNYNICVYADIPTCTTKISPASGASIVSGANLSWNAATYAAGYDVYLDVVNPPLTMVSSNQAGTTYTTSGLTGSTNYYWMVIPRNAAGTATGCSVDSFTTNPPPAIPLPTSPAVGSTTRVASNLVLSWPASAGATAYDVYFNNGTTAYNLVSAGQAGLTYTVTSITPDVYAWKVVPSNANGYATGAIDWTFYDSLPAGPSLPITITNGGSTPLDSNVVLSWLTVNGATGYDVYLDAGTGSATTLVSSNQSATNYHTSSIALGSYTWRVVPTNANGGISSPDWSFTVTLPACISGTIQPTNNSVACANTVSNISWLTVNGARGYDVYLDAGSSAPSTLVSSNQSGTSYSILGAPAGTYSWRVEPHNNNGSTSGCTNFKYSITNPVLASVTPATRCGAGSVTLSATPTVSTDSVVWFAAATGGIPLAYGTNYTTTASANTTYYAAEMDASSFSIQNHLGYAANSAGLATGYNVERGIVFTAYSGFTFNSAQYYSSTTNVTNTITYYLRDQATGNIITQGTTSVVQGASPAWYTMNLNVTVPGAGNYRLTCSYTSSVDRLTSGANYASTAFNYLGTFGLITGDWDYSALNLNSYSYFHDISATASGCIGARQPVSVTVTSPVAISAGTGTTICQGTSTTLGASSSDPDYVYSWTPTTGLSSASGASPVASPSSTTLYTAHATNPFTGCAATDTVRVRVSLAPTTPVVMPSSPSVCAGVSLPLAIQSGSNISLGTATTTNANTGQDPFNSFYEGEHKQYLITAAELNAMGYTSAGNIGAISFNVNTQVPATQTGGGATVQTDFKISMGLTSATSMASGYATPIGGSLSLVYGPTNLAPPAVGVNKFTFATPFAWDGVSNIVVDVCHDNDVSSSCTSCYTSGGAVAATTTSFTSVYGSYNDNLQACGVVASLTTSGADRPDMVFDFVGNSGAVWTSASSPLNLYLDSAATNPYAGTVESKVYVNAFATQTYTVTATNAANCTASSNVTVTINTAPSAPANFAKSNVTSTSFDLTWNSTTNTSDYLVDVSDNSGFTTFVTGYNGLSVFTTNASVAGLTPGTVYYARVRSRNSCFSSSNSTITILLKPSAPSSLFSSSVTSSGYTANWTGSFGATSYLLDVSTNRTFSTFVSGYNGLSVSGSNQAISGLSQGTKYFYRLRSVNASGNSAFSISDSVTTGTNSVNVALTAYLQGLYQGSGVMIAAPFAADGVTSNLIADTITVQLYTAAGSLAYSSTATLSTSGLANVTFPGGAIGNSYYIVVRHRNSIATSSTSTVTIAASNANYNFSSAASQAMGDNLVDLGGGLYGIYTGDINQDGSVDFNDYPDLDISSSNGDLGYLPFDLNGDASVDFNDYPMIDVNSSNGIIAMLPF